MTECDVLDGADYLMNTKSKYYPHSTNSSITMCEDRKDGRKF